MRATHEEQKEPVGRECAICGRTTMKICAGCKGVSVPEVLQSVPEVYHYWGIAYCGRDCQKRDWPRHRKSCKTINVTVRMMGGHSMMLENLPIGTNLLEIARNVSAWVYEKQPESVKQEYEEEDIIINLLYKGERQRNIATLDELGVTEHDEFLVVGQIRPMPELITSSDQGF